MLTSTAVYQPVALRSPWAGCLNNVSSQRQETKKMRQAFQQELSEVQDRLVEIAELVKIAITDATAAFNESDLALAEQVIENDAHIDELSLSLDELSIQILARQQPVARDLRVVVSALRMSASLERMGDIAEHIASLTRYRFPERVVAKGLRGTFREMGELDVEIATRLVELLRSQDNDLADEMRDLDDKVDALHLKVFGKVLDEAWGGTTADTVDATLASRYHERFGDHAVSISKKVKYLSTGDWADQGDAAN
jgi:phosphate transport system protein